MNFHFRSSSKLTGVLKSYVIELIHREKRKVTRRKMGECNGDVPSPDLSICVSGSFLGLQAFKMLNQYRRALSR